MPARYEYPYVARSGIHSHFGVGYDKHFTASTHKAPPPTPKDSPRYEPPVEREKPRYTPPAPKESPRFEQPPVRERPRDNQPPIKDSPPLRNEPKPEPRPAKPPEREYKKSPNDAIDQKSEKPRR